MTLIFDARAWRDSRRGRPDDRPGRKGIGERFQAAPGVLWVLVGQGVRKVRHVDFGRNPQDPMALDASELPLTALGLADRQPEMRGDLIGASAIAYL